MELANRESVESFMARVGLLEDNCHILKLVATMLHYAGHQVTIYEHAFACLKALLLVGGTEDRMPGAESIQHMPTLPIDVLILDLHLPKIDDGVEVLRYLQAYSLTRSLPLIFCTAATNTELARALSLAPHAKVVEKPFKVPTLLSTLNAVLEPV